MAQPAGVQTITNEPPNNYKTMKKKSFIVKSLAFVFGTALFAACTTVDNPVGPGEPGTDVPEVLVPADVTAKVGTATNDWTGPFGVGECGEWAAPAALTADGRRALMVENYQTNVDATGIILQQTIEGLENGQYTVELYANAFYTPNRGFESSMADGATDVAYVFANDSKTYMTGNVAETTTQNGEYTVEAEVTDGTLTIGLGKDQAGTNWHTIQIKSLTLQTPLSEAYAQVLASAEAVADKKMAADAKAALAAALSAPQTLENYEALAAAVQAAVASASVYEQVGVKLANMKALVDATNVYTEEALAAYYTNYAEKYEAGTLTVEEGNTLQDPNKVTGWHDAITVDNFLLSAWDTNPDFIDAPYYINTWSVEGDNDGSNFRVPFFEYWTGDGDSLGERTLTATMEGLAAGDYEVSAWVRVRAKNGYEAPAYGITLQANDGEAVNVSGGDFVAPQFYLGNFTAAGTVGADGVLKIKFNVAADNNISWLSYKNVKYTKK